MISITMSSPTSSCLSLSLSLGGGRRQHSKTISTKSLCSSEHLFALVTMFILFSLNFNCLQRQFLNEKIDGMEELTSHSDVSFISRALFVVCN